MTQAVRFLCDENEPEIFVRDHDFRFAFLWNYEESTILDQRVEAIEDRWRTAVCVGQHNPSARANGHRQWGIHPFELSARVTQLLRELTDQVRCVHLRMHSNLRDRRICHR